MKAFLIKAKLNTYASQQNEIIKEDGSRELTFQEGKYSYQDIYFGSNPFIGQEIVFEKNKPIWGMNYYGQAKTIAVYQFLKEALRQVTEDLPFRGPEEFSREDWQYKNQVEGDLNFFKGKEQIFHQGKLVYELEYSGGKIERLS